MPGPLSLFANANIRSVLRVAQADVSPRRGANKPRLLKTDEIF